MRQGGLKKAQCFLIIFSLLMIFPLHAVGSGRLYPLTLLEMQKIISNWLHESGYRVTPSGLPDGAIQLTGVRENEHCRMVLQAHSPLYASVDARCFSGERTNPQRLRELSAFLDDYVAKNTQASQANEAQPPHTLPPVHAVVCIQAVSGDTPISFSGFVVDSKGIILSTAHDLDSVKDVTVMTSDGRKLKGRLIRKDKLCDLAMIRVESRLKTSVNLSAGRNFLKKGEPVYAPICLEGERKILSGTVAAAVKVQKNLHLWQVEMDTPRGSSGSPVFDRDGRIVAMIKGRYRGNSSVGFVIPFETIMQFLGEE